MKIFVLEDHTTLGRVVKSALSSKGYTVDWFTHLSDLEAAYNPGLYDLFILDLSVPDGRSTAWLGTIRKNGDFTPSLILTASDALADKLEGFDRGADDYLTKPFEIEELFARVRALIRRRERPTVETLRFGRYVADLRARTLNGPNGDLKLTAKEFTILETLLLHKGSVVSKDALNNQLYDFDSTASSNVLEVLIARLRKKLESSAIKTVRGEGYTIDENPL